MKNTVKTRSRVVMRLMVIMMILSVMFMAWTPAAKVHACDEWDDWDEWEESVDYEDYDDWDEYDEWDDGYEHPVSDAAYLNGIYKLSADGQTLTDIYSTTELGHNIESYDGSSVKWWLCPVLWPERINSGEKLVLAGTEWSCRSDADKEAQIICYQDMHLLGYGNASSLPNLSFRDFETINGKSISGINTDPDAINSVLSGTGLEYHSYCVLNDSYTPIPLLLSDTQDDSVTIDFYDGTEYTSEEFGMVDPYYYYENFNQDKLLHVEKTDKGYFIVDTSTLPPGTYSIMSWSGVYAFEIA